MRYRGQEHTVTVNWPAELCGAPELISSFRRRPRAGLHVSARRNAGRNRDLPSQRDAASARRSRNADVWEGRLISALPAADGRGNCRGRPRFRTGLADAGPVLFRAIARRGAHGDNPGLAWTEAERRPLRVSRDRRGLACAGDVQRSSRRPRPRPPFELLTSAFEVDVDLLLGDHREQKAIVSPMARQTT